MAIHNGQQVISKPSPSSGLEETFNEMGMTSRDSPGHGTFSSKMQFPNAQFTYDTGDGSTPLFGKTIMSPLSQSSAAEIARPEMILKHKSYKSRVETQIPIQLILSPLPPGIKKLRLPSHTIAKPKFFAKSETEGPSPDTYELHTSLVCTSAMEDPVKLQKALARARGEDPSLHTGPSPTSSNDSHSLKPEDDNPLNGAEVKICSGCIARERKRNSRKKLRKPEEEEIFQKDEEKRVIVFNTHQIKDWHEPSGEEGELNTVGVATGQPRDLAPGAMQVDLPMRIACYCRHQHEKMGFMVIFTIRDYQNNYVAQARTESIMITDDHKTSNMPPQFQTAASAMPPGPHFPGSGVFPAATFDGPSTASSMGPRPFRTSLSTTDLSGMQNDFNPQFPMSATGNAFAVPNPISVATSGTLTPKNLSRAPSPTGTPGPNTKRRKHSGSGKIPSNLTMTRLETSQPVPTSNSVVNSPFTPQGPLYAPDPNYTMQTLRGHQTTTSPPTPNSNSDFGFMTANNRSFSMENLPRQPMISAPSSRQPSRPGSPNLNRNSFNQADAAVNHAMSSQQFNQNRRPQPLIHKLIPAEGSVTGGTEVSLLGNGFYQGVEVMFGDIAATTTTYWADKCLTCLTPPAARAGAVAVVFKHEHPLYSQRPRPSQQRPLFFNYIEDSEHEMLKLALRTLGPTLPQPTSDPWTAAQQLIGASAAPAWMGSTAYHGAPHMQASAGRPVDMLELENHMLQFLSFLDTATEHRPCLDYGSTTGHTLLHLASFLGLTRLVVGLATRGANLNSLDRNGNTPMHLAALNGHHHIIHRLRLAGADNRIRSLRNYLPADMASTRQASEASVLPTHHYRTRSAGGTPMRLQSFNASFTSASTLADSSSASDSSEDDSNFSTDEDGNSNTARTQSKSAVVSPRPSRRPSLHEFRRVTSSRTPSRRPSGNELSDPRMITNSGDIEDVSAMVSPAAYMLAWRDQLAGQIHQYQQNAQRFLPNLPTLPNLPQLPTLPDYQTHPMVRRVSSLFPQRALSRPPTAQSNKESWWESWTGSPPASAAPPPYEELYPTHESEQDAGLKKESVLRALADAALDQHFEASVNTDRMTSKSPSPEPSNFVKQEAGPLAEQQGVKRLQTDRALHFFWIPLLVVILTLSLKNVVPDLSHTFVQGYQYFAERYAPRSIQTA
ncbi:MAG: hypothetical protein Q9227_008739 [Pyrenula ochraceoflavens]